MKVINVVGARPNFMKVAPLHRAFQEVGIESLIVHTGQHYDEKMSDIFFTQLEMPEPDVYLGVGSASHAEQTARIMTAFETVIEDETPDLVLVVGDVNSTVACSLVATKMNLPVAHVEAGLRSGDRRMPEEINRIVTDSIADFLFVTEESGVENLKQEGVPDEKVAFVGNVMIDALVSFRKKAAKTHILEELGLDPGTYVAMTMHRPSNVDNREGLGALLSTIERVAASHPVVFPMHPRTANRFKQFGLADDVKKIANLTVLEPLGYLEFLRLMEHAGTVVTDSGGIQEETTFLQVPCLTLRENTERPITIEQGTNELMPLDPEAVAARVDELMGGSLKDGHIPPLWDGNASKRIIQYLTQHM
ncbi:UDP-N-acetylglucosamine 2-epimerase (non-hydrolyzing) [Longimonas halophila]|jgi:UDP-N-acetylglucosamine 2-epimerase (non-hydrolysing)|uniref:UDP-N-acetylglucosamine 2-epimerase (Non-hydrolyzing) n=1 Tax=Longimonas halophila TaxID=1469170 RepID=A0A2H3P764_9BACT|nr:UDP-N-acetylglucosamine 2-epimerase (non-hydrolyzing) [Longimonas halophila]PEN08388.1 UDP-N-acetylglucosamine 2-epimerase (non-hydrolyzing) [Longimonas halophila]